MRKFILNDLTEVFDEVKDHIPKTALIRPENVVLFISDIQKCVWIWLGSNTTQKQRFLAPYKATTIRDLYGNYYRIKTAEQGEEPLAFKMMIGSDMAIQKWEIPEITIKESNGGFSITDNRGNMLYMSHEFFPKFKEQIKELI